MNVKYLLAILLLFSSQLTIAQLLDKLKQRAQERGMETRELSYDSTAYDSDAEVYEDERVIRSAHDFYDKDVIMALYKENILIQTAYFDEETIAMRTEQVGNPHPIYHDDSGKIYAYNGDEDQYETMTLLPSSSMGFMTAGMTTQFYKLPHEPYFNALKALDALGSGLNFLVLEMAFIYNPNHFRNNDYYIEKIVSCNGTNNCVKFIYDDPEYEGSYIQFDDQDRLDELYINSNNPKAQENPTGKFVFDYKPCSVKLPKAVERSMVPGPLGKILPLEKGLEPWKYNKADKQKNN